jgi:hypothetical protein
MIAFGKGIGFDFAPGKGKNAAPITNPSRPGATLLLAQDEHIFFVCL